MSAPVWDGVPLNPERDGWHWLKHPEDLRPCPVGWDAMHSAWCGGGMHSSRGIIELGYTYLGPLILPADHAAVVEAAREDERKRALAALTEPSDGKQYGHASVMYLIDGFHQALRQAKRIRKHRRIITRLLAMRRDANTKVEAAAQAEREGIAKWHDCNATIYEVTAAKLTGANRDSFEGYAKKHREYAAAIRARGPTDALAAALAKAREEALEEAAIYLDGRKRAYETRADVAIACRDDEGINVATVCAAMFEAAATAIRALAGKEQG